MFILKNVLKGNSVRTEGDGGEASFSCGLHVKLLITIMVLLITISTSRKKKSKKLNLTSESYIK